MGLDRRQLGWGIFFILLGAVPLAVRTDVIRTDVVDRWPQLWPLLLVGWGLGLLLRRTSVGWLGGALAAVTLGLMGGGLIATGFNGFPGITGCGPGNGGTAFEPAAGTLGSGGSVNVEFNCGTLDVSTVDGSSWRLTGTDQDGHAPRVAVANDSVDIRTPDNGSGFAFGAGSHPSWELMLPRSPQLALGMTLNAGRETVDLTGASIGSLSLTVNAGSLVAKLGQIEAPKELNATLNAGSASIDAPPTGDMNLSLNAGSIDLCVPAGAAVRVHWSGALASHDLDSAGLVRVDNSTWATQAFDAGVAHLELQVSANAGSFNLKIGGSCGGA